MVQESGGMDWVSWDGVAGLGPLAKNGSSCGPKIAAFQQRSFVLKIEMCGRVCYNSR